jgi:hypothetical protein
MKTHSPVSTDAEWLIINPNIFRYDHPPDSVLAGDFFCSTDFFGRKIKVRF